MRIAQFTNEYPPNVYGGAGVHVEYLSRELARADGGEHRVDVLCFGDQHETHGNLRVHGVARPLTNARLVLTTHSLEPHRPWKVEQLGTAYHATTWIERTAYQNADGVVAVSAAMQADVQVL